MEQSTLKNEEIKPESRATKFKESSISTRITFLLGIITLVLTAVYICTGGFLPNDFGKIPLYIIGSFFIALALAGVVFGIFSIQKDKNIYGIIGTSVSAIVLGFHIFLLIVIITAGFPPPS
jgi:hypothetical protein